MAVFGGKAWVLRLESHNGSNVESGIVTGVVIETGPWTYFGQVAEKIVTQRVLTSFDKGITLVAREHELRSNCRLCAPHNTTKRG